MAVYYNEIDSYAAQWLRNLIAAGHIAPGDVDERSIVDVRPDELRGYTQAHFFAGIGGWSHALRLAGWPDDRPVWTGSCPCQPFSAAGQGKAADDERHLWPAWFPLIAERRPPTVFGEQVEAAIGWGWLDAVFADLEAEGYACGAAVLPACGVGAPHIRQRLWFVADAQRSGRDNSRLDEREHVAAGRSKRPFALDERQSVKGCDPEIRYMADSQRGAAERRRHDMGESARLIEGKARQRQRQRRDDAGPGVEPCGLVNSNGRHASAEGLQRGGEQRQQPQDGRSGRMADSIGAGLEILGLPQRSGRALRGRQARGLAERSSDIGELGDPSRDEQRWSRLDESSDRRSSALGRSSPWSDLDWLPCTDGKARPTQPGLFPLAHGIPARVGKLRAAGNAIVPQVAAQFIKAAVDSLK